MYHITAYPVDENGSAVTGTQPYANGSWDIVELDNKNIVTITPVNRGPYNTPQLSASGWDNQKFTFTCNSTGDTTIALRLSSTNPRRGLVTGFSYTTQNYPQPDDVLSSVGSGLYFGNTLAIHCTSYDTMNINVN